MAARTYIPTLVRTLQRLETYIERYDRKLEDNMTDPEKAALVVLLQSIKSQLAVSG